MTWTCSADFDDTTEPSAVSPELLALCETGGEQCAVKPRSEPPRIIISSVPPPAIEVDVTRSRILVPRWGILEVIPAPSRTVRAARFLWRLLTAPLRLVSRSGRTFRRSRGRP